jgi:hypothetical protein
LSLDFGVDLKVTARREGIQHAIEVPGNVLREEAENQVTLFLKQTVLAAVAPVRDGIGEVLRAIEFDGNA